MFPLVRTPLLQTGQLFNSRTSIGPFFMLLLVALEAALISVVFLNKQLKIAQQYQC